nr:reverse transcriptase domain-containing protein [Tanacetum cinerariifolium]
MTGVPRSVVEHQLNIQEGNLLVRQKKRGQAQERAKAIQAEVQKLVEAGIMREVYDHDWLSNPVMVKKHDGSGRSVLGIREKSLPLFKTLKKCIIKSDFHWTSEAKQAFKQLKQHFSELPLLVAPKPKEELIVYISASYGAIGAVLMNESGATQMPVYFIKMPNESPPATPVVETQQEPWTLFSDGSSCVDGSSVGLIRTSPEGTEFTYALRFQFTASNNEAEYEALIAGLRIIVQMGVQNVHVIVDSKLVANQVLGTYVAKEENMIKYLEKVKSLVEYMIREIHKGSCSMHTGPRKAPTVHGLVKRVNRSLGEGIKARLGEGSKNWVEELSYALWAHRTMIKSSHGDTPFSLTYGTEAIIPAEIRMPTYRTAGVDVVYNDLAMTWHLLLS